MNGLAHEPVPVHIPGTSYVVGRWVWNPRNETVVLVEEPEARLMYGQHAVGVALEVARTAARQLHDDLLARIGKPLVSTFDASGELAAAPILSAQQMIRLLDPADRRRLRDWLVDRFDDSGQERPLMEVLVDPSLAAGEMLIAQPKKRR